MSINRIKRRQFLKTTAAVAGTMAVGLPSAAKAAGKPVEAPRLLTATAQFDPVRPETARLISQAAKEVGFGIEATPEDYNLGIQKVIKEHDYDMFLVLLTGQSVRIDPDVFIHKVHHSSNYRSGGFNWTGYANPAVDELAAAQQVEMDPVRRQEIVRKAQVLIAADQPENALVYPAMTNAYRSDRIANLTPQMGEGIGSLWTDVSMTVIKGDGHVRTGATVALKNLNPVAVNDANEFKELRMIYDSLFQVDPDGKAVPWAAESHTLVDDLTIDVTIRDGMKWHDGKPVTAADVKFSFDYQKQWKAPFFVSSLAMVESVEVTGPRTVRFKLTSRFAPLFANLFSALMLIPEHIWKDIPEKVDVDDPLNFPNLTPVGSGPFRFDYWDRGKELKLSANPDHHMAPKCAGIIRIVYGSHDAMAAAIEKGECDRTRYILKPNLMEALNKIEGVVGKGYPAHGFYSLSYNLTKPPFDNAAIRQAMQYIIPRELIRDVVLGGHAESGGSVIAPVNAFWHNSDVKAPGQDLDKAKKILADAGFTWEDGKLHYPA
jgi:peptide/nickel transport system substrate-binding protein